MQDAWSCVAEWSLARTAEAPLEHNFRYPRIRELMYMGGALALGGPLFLILFSFSSPPLYNNSQVRGDVPRLCPDLQLYSY